MYIISIYVYKWTPLACTIVLQSVVVCCSELTCGNIDPKQFHYRPRWQERVLAACRARSTGALCVAV